LKNLNDEDGSSMVSNRQFLERIAALFQRQKLAVLSTQHAGQPYASLVAFYAAADCKYLYFVTPRTTRKFANLVADNRVALLINSSVNRASDFHRAIAVTAVGKAAEIDDENRELVRVQYLQKHPHLEEFAGSPTSALVRVAVASYYMVKNFQNVMELHLDT
jgi:nitroimidazol reductase NimA-like FMN-containing flavoprotein (pyridoxamine 5'-phosphate oxidase superfamily)